MNNVQTQQEIEDMMGKLNSFLDHIRNTFINASELAGKVEAMQAQMTELTAQVAQITQQNQALQETINVLTTERDQGREKIAVMERELQEVRGNFQSRDNDANHWYAQYQDISAELAKAKADRTSLEEDHLRVLGEYEEVKAKLEKIQAVFEAAQPVLEQPRDPQTQRWMSPYGDVKQVG